MSEYAKQRGFTIIELMVIVTIVAILAAIALPFYEDFGARARRADGVTALEEIRLGQEKWRASNISYSSTITEVWLGGKNGCTDCSHDGHYYLCIEPACGNSPPADATTVALSPTSYTAKAMPIGGHSGDKCGWYKINQDGPVTDDANYAGEQCWRGR